MILIALAVLLVVGFVLGISCARVAGRDRRELYSVDLLKLSDAERQEWFRLTLKLDTLSLLNNEERDKVRWWRNR